MTGGGPVLEHLLRRPSLHVLLLGDERSERAPLERRLCSDALRVIGAGRVLRRRAAVAATATMGLGLFFIPVYWIAVMLQVYWLEDRRNPAK